MSDASTLTLLLTDLVDSTQLLHDLGDQQAADVLGRHDRLARDLLAAHRGREIDKSDGFLFVFEEPADAVRYALAFHAGLQALSDELSLPLLTRAGLHTGEVRVVQNSEADVARGAKPIEVEGIAKPTAARIMALACGGQTLLSPATRDLLAQAPPAALDPELRLISHGCYRLKGMDEPIEIFEIGAEGVAPLRPPPDAPKAWRVVRAGDGWRPASEVPHHLPGDLHASFGRERELRALADAFAEGARLVTLVGPGGTGKTHLALRYARAWLGDWPGGAWFCDLSEARTALDLVRTVGRVLDVPLEQDDPVITLAEALRHRGRTLLVLDNLEQLLEAVPGTLLRWLERVPETGWLVTSRQRLGLRGERLLPVDPLPLPDESTQPSAILANPSVRLFIDRAKAVHPSFVAEGETARDVARLVRLLDGLPLAIELAAARVRVLPPQRILERMGRRFDLLRAQRGFSTERQATLRGAIDWSWELLSPPLRAALAQCAVFEGGFDLEAAEAVIDLSPWEDAPWPMDAIEALVDGSLLRALPGAEARFSLFRSIHEYAIEKLDGAGGVEQPDGSSWSGARTRQEVEARHAAWFSRWGEPGCIDALHGREALALRHRLEAELENTMIAARRAAALGDGETAAKAAIGALALLETRGPLPLADEIGEVALQAGPPPQLAAQLQVALGVVRTRAGRPDPSLLEAALAGARWLKDPALEGAALAALGQGAVLRGAYEEARQQLEEALELQRRARDRRGEATTLAELAHVVGIRGGDFDRGQELIEAALSLQVQRGDLAGEALSRSYQGAISAIAGDFETGRNAYEAARSLAHEVGDRRTAGLAEGMIAGICVLVGDLDSARTCFEAALETQRSIGDRVHEAMHAANYAQLLGRIGERDLACTLLHRAVAIARETGDPMTEGLSLGALGALRCEAGAMEEGRLHLAEGEARLRQANDPNELAKLLCKAGQVELGLGDRKAAQARLAEAQAIARELGVGEGSELAGAVAALADALGR